VSKERGGKVGVELGLTYNLGNYESLRVNVILEEGYNEEPGSTRDVIFSALLDDARSKLYETLGAEIKNYRELKGSLTS
jgi:hypothetical protein